jgi:hypothetical protein
VEVIMKSTIALAIALSLASATHVEAGFVIGSQITSNSSYGPEWSILLGTNLGKIFSPSATSLIDPGVEFTAPDQLAQILNQDAIKITADLTPTTVQIAFDVSAGTQGYNLLSDSWQFEFDNLIVANGEKIAGLSLLSSQGVSVSSTGFTGNSISINVQGYSGSTPIGTNNIRSVTYTVEFQNAVPEPSTFALTAVGAIALLTSRRQSVRS